MGEPTLEEVLADPIVHLMMAADRVPLADLRDIIRQQREALENAMAE